MKRRINKKRVAFIAAVFTIIISIIIYLIINIIFLISTPNTPTVQKAKKVSKKDPFTSLNYYLPSQKKRYENYKTKYPDLSDEEVVTYVNMNLDYNFYDHIIIQSNPSALNTLVILSFR